MGSPEGPSDYPGVSAKDVIQEKVVCFSLRAGIYAEIRAGIYAEISV